MRTENLFPFELTVVLLLRQLEGFSVYLQVFILPKTDTMCNKFICRKKSTVMKAA